MLVLRGARVILPVRSLNGGKSANKRLLLENPSAEIEVAEMDLSSLKSVASFASHFSASGQPLNILV